ncbi:B-cell antigen receptor complex-associated protein alpha chain isoform X1 [Corvus hawaiiensis]|uniref:B-cell antigen receptor complex-associated protein alpha chain isoform X1 n=1 Tax=Corvus hawaiiensis TaxID=134902 RepID=UPI00201869BC|nr:B-cell antigen receptor complex-associated protein alpha chain isoform X1 [Corvus hawaiiensis]
MEAAPQTWGAAPKQGVPSLLLILLLLLPGSKCHNDTNSPISSLAVNTTPRSGPSCGPWPEVHVWPGPPSRSGALGDPLTLECRFKAPAAAKVTWLQVCPRRYRGDSWSCSWPQEVSASGKGLEVVGGDNLSKLNFQHLEHNHSGLYFCRVEFGKVAARSCGTFVRVREPVPVPFLDLGEATKNRILTAQGVLLLLCAAGPGLLLLFRKRWANERLLQPKKISCEEENLYEGLNLDECSMYEDISRGVQPTYQDVGTPPTTDGLLEKP